MLLHLQDFTPSGGDFKAVVLYVQLEGPSEKVSPLCLAPRDDNLLDDCEKTSQHDDDGDA